MALVGEIVARFRAETSDYLAKLEAAKTKNRELAAELLKTAGSADRAIASLQQAKKAGALSDFGLDPRQASGVIAAIRQIERESKAAHTGLRGLAESFGEHRVLGKIMRGGAIGFIGDRLGQMTGKLVEMRKEVAKGIIPAESISALPIIGGYLQTLINIREMVTGEKAALEARNKLLEEGVKWREQEKQRIAEQAKLQFEFQAAVDAARAKAANAGKSGIAGTLGQSAAEADTIRKRAAFDAESQTRAAKDEWEKKIADLNKLIAPMIGTKYKASRERILEQMRTVDEEYQEKLKQIKERVPALEAADLGAVAATDRAAIEAYNDQIEAAAREHQQRVADIARDGARKVDESRQAGFQAGIAGQGQAFAAELAQIRDRADQQKRAVADAVDKARQQYVAAKAAFEAEEGRTGSTTQSVGEARLKMTRADEVLKVEATAADDARAAIDRLREAEEKRAAANLRRSLGLETPAEQFMQKARDAVAMANKGALSDADLGKFFTTAQRDAAAELKSLMAESDRAVYRLPDVKDLRAGSALFAPPNKGLDQKQLDRLNDIRTLLQNIRDGATDAGVTVEQITI